jgi:hypothetical protein
MQSSAHRKNILEPTFKRVAIGAPRLRATVIAYVILSTVASLAVLSWTGLVMAQHSWTQLRSLSRRAEGSAIGALAFRHVSRALLQRLTPFVLARAGLIALVAVLR